MPILELMQKFNVMNDKENSFFGINLMCSDINDDYSKSLENDFIQKAMMIEQQKMIENYFLELEERSQKTFKRNLIIEKNEYAKFDLDSFFIPIRNYGS